MESIILLGLLFLLMWAVLIRPQQRRARQHQEILQSLQVGDEVVTAGGIFGRIVEIDDSALTVEVARDVRLRFLRGAISRKVEPASPEPPAPG